MKREPGMGKIEPTAKSDGEGSSGESDSSLPGEKSPRLGSVHTNTFANVLSQFRTSVGVTTYQAGKVVLLRPQIQDGKVKVNTHFRNFQKPMGFAWEGGRFAVGTHAEIWEFHDIPAVARKLEVSPDPDAVFLARNCCLTGGCSNP
jgi:hypothetical protein